MVAPVATLVSEQAGLVASPRILVAQWVDTSLAVCAPPPVQCADSRALVLHFREARFCMMDFAAHGMARSAFALSASAVRAAALDVEEGWDIPGGAMIRGFGTGGTMTIRSIRTITTISPGPTR